jgi:hypothetical protein
MSPHHEADAPIPFATGHLLSIPEKICLTLANHCINLVKQWFEPWFEPLSESFGQILLVR